MKPLFLYILLLLTYYKVTQAQMCPGGGTDFTNAVTFDPAWIYGCNTGTSCNGGVHFDNRIACEPTTAITSCAPAPSCVTLSNTSSDIWFKFYAAAETVTIKGFQNTSFVLGVQAFSGGSTCGTLTDIGCATASGPSSGVTLTLSGLTVGEIYYYRVFGSAGPVSQRSGLYCFCGTTGLQNYVLPSVLNKFTGINKDEYNQLNWTILPEADIVSVEVQKSIDGIHFFSLKTIETVNVANNYFYQDHSTGNNTVYYRIKLVDGNGKGTYSSALTLKYKSKTGISVISNMPGKPVEIQASVPAVLKLYNASGHYIRSYSLTSGKNIIETKMLSSGIYFMQNVGKKSSAKIFVVND